MVDKVDIGYEMVVEQIVERTIKRARQTNYFFGRKMKQEYILEPKQKIDVKEKQTLKSLLTQEQVEDFQCGKIVATCGGVKLSLEDEIKDTVLILTPLQGG